MARQTGQWLLWSENHRPAQQGRIVEILIVAVNPSGKIIDEFDRHRCV